MSINPARDELASRIAAGAAVQCPEQVESISLRWPANNDDSLVLNLYLKDKRIEIRATCEDLGITIPKACNPIEAATPFYWRHSTDPMERMIEIANCSPFDENPWLSSGAGNSLDW